MLGLLALALAAIGLLAALRADPIWYTILPLGILTCGGLMGHSLCWFNRKVKE
jgi:hypothetical protein